MSTEIPKDQPRRFRWPVHESYQHPNGSKAEWRYGAYFPATDLCVSDMGERGTGEPKWKGLEWIDHAN